MDRHPLLRPKEFAEGLLDALYFRLCFETGQTTKATPKHSVENQRQKHLKRVENQGVIMCKEDLPRLMYATT
jgi:hypothetical protein